MAARWRDGSADHYDDFGWRPYVTQAERRRKAQARIRQLEKKGQQASPVIIRGRRIATTFWGSAWCENLERYSDYANRLPRGRTYVRNGSVIDLRIGPGKVEALVCGSSIYRVRVDVSPVAAARWKGICRKSAGEIASLVELLQGRFSNAVMEHMCRPGEGLFPTPGEIRFSCSCPDWAYMCKHVSAVLYGIGARLDESPELLFRLRKVDERDLIAQAGEGLPVTRERPGSRRILSGESLSEMFGVDLATPGPEMPEPRRAGRPSGKRSLTPAMRQAISERMKRYWAERRQEAAEQRNKQKKHKKQKK